MAATDVHDRPRTLSALAVRVWLAVVGLVSLATVVPAAPNDYMLSVWTLSYERGYRARALPASVLQWAGFDRVTPRLVATVSVVLLLVALVLLVELGARAYRHDQGLPTLLLGVLLVGSPVTLQMLAFDLASFDNVIVVLTLASLLIVLGSPGPAGLVAVGLLATLSTLTHEGFVLLGLPLIVGAVVVIRRGAPWRRIAGHVAVVVLGPAVALAWVQAAPLLPADEVPAREAEVRKRAELEPGSDRVAWPIRNHSRSLTDNIEHSARQVTRRGHRDHAVALLACLPSFLVAAAVGSRWVSPRHRRPLVLLWVGVVVAPLLLAPVAHDWGRWLTFSTFNALIAVVWVKARRRSPADTAPSHAWVALVAIAFLLPTLARNGSFRVRVGQPLELLRLILGL